MSVKDRMDHRGSLHTFLYGGRMPVSSDRSQRQDGDLPDVRHKADQGMYPAGALVSLRLQQKRKNGKHPERTGCGGGRKHL